MNPNIIIFVFIAVVLIYWNLLKDIEFKNYFKKKQNSKNPTLGILLKRANVMHIMEDYNSAIAISDKIIQTEPENYDALVTRACCLEALNYNFDAIDDYEKALQIDNSDGNIYGLLGLTYRKIGDFENGQNCLKKSIELGVKVYELNYEMFANGSDAFKEAYIKKSNISENQLRRNSNDFVDNLSEVDSKEFNEAVKNKLYHLENAIALDPNNNHLKNIYEFAKSQIN